MTDFQKVIKYLAIAFAVFLIVMIFSGIIGALSLFSYAFNSNDGSQNTGANEFVVTTDVSKLDVDISFSELIINTGDEFKVSYDDRNKKVKLDGDELEITDRKKMFSFNQEGYSIILTVPKNFKFDEVSLHTGSGNIELNDFFTNKLDFELGAGNVTLNNVTVDKSADIEGGAGNLTFSDCKISNLDLDLGVGNCTLNSALLGNCDINCGVGDSEISLLKIDGADYMISVNKGIGKATVNGEEVPSNTTFGAGVNRVDIECGVGDVNVKY